MAQRGQRDRWLSRRALLLHLAVVVLAPACALAGWWQATRALAGNGLSWFYSVEWPVFSLLVVAGWWHLIHEDPEERRARKLEAAELQAPASAGAGPVPEAPVEAERAAPDGGSVGGDRVSLRLAGTLGALVVVELAVGIAAFLTVPFGRPSGVLPARGAALYVAHASLGVPLVVLAVAFVLHSRSLARIPRLSARVGAIGIVLAGLGGLLCFWHAGRFAGAALMLLGAVTAAIGYAFPVLERIEAD